MSDLQADLQHFTQHGYQILEELGHNSLGGRVTYKARHLKTGQFAAIKQFQFATTQSTWTDYESLEREIEMLRHLNHPGIPRYLDSFQTEDGFCLVQEYLDAKSLATPRSWTPQQVKEVALSVLEILVYLQSQNPPVIHRDIKPENILIDDRDRVYLIDFGFARTGGGEIAASSVVKGTMGFMPPEQLFDRFLTEASDLYGLGGTLICLLTGTKSIDIGHLIDDEYRVRFRHLVPPLKRGWLSWLEKLVEPKMGDRYPNATEALAALETIDVEALPKVRIDRQHLEFSATRYGEKVTRNITVSNPIPNTLLSGRWEVAAHPNDSPDNPWITFEPIKFDRNSIVCPITVDTSQLLANTCYKRQILLQTNASPETYSITLQINTAPLPQPQLFNTFSLARSIFILLFAGVGWVLSSSFHSSLFGLSETILIGLFLPGLAAFFAIEPTVSHKGTKLGYRLVKSLLFSLLGMIFCVGIADLIFSNKLAWFFFGQVGAVFGGLASVFWHPSSRHFKKTKIKIFGNYYAKSWQQIGAFAIAALCFIGIIFSVILIGEMALKFVLITLGYYLATGGLVMLMVAALYIVAHVCWAIFGQFVKTIVRGHVLAGTLQSEAAQMTLLAAGFGLSLGVAIRLFFGVWFPGEGTESLNLWLVSSVAIASIAATSLPLLNKTIFQPARIIKRYHRSKQQFIQS